MRVRGRGPPGSRDDRGLLAATLWPARARWFRAAARACAVPSPGGALAGAADLRAARPDSCPPYWMPQPLLPALPPPSSPCAAGSYGPSGGEVKQEPVGGRGRRGWRV